MLNRDVIRVWVDKVISSNDVQPNEARIYIKNAFLILVKSSTVSRYLSIIITL